MIDLANYNIEDFKLGKSGRAVKLFYNKEPLQICTSILYTPFGVKSINKEWSNFTEYNIDCSLNQSSSDISINFKEFIDKLNVIIVKLVNENKSLFVKSGDLFNDNFTYSPILRENKNYPKLMKLQLTRDKNGNFETFIFNEKKEKVSINENNIETILTKGKTFKTIIECVKIWYFDGKVGSIWKISQLKFCENSYKSTEDPDEITNNTNLNIYTQCMINE